MGRYAADNRRYRTPARLRLFIKILPRHRTANPSFLFLIFIISENFLTFGRYDLCRSRTNPKWTFAYE